MVHAAAGCVPLRVGQGLPCAAGSGLSIGLCRWRAGRVCALDQILHAGLFPRLGRGHAGHGPALGRLARSVGRVRSSAGRRGAGHFAVGGLFRCKRRAGRLVHRVFLRQPVPVRLGRRQPRRCAAKGGTVAFVRHAAQPAAGHSAADGPGLPSAPGQKSGPAGGRGACRAVFWPGSYHLWCGRMAVLLSDFHDLSPAGFHAAGVAVQQSVLPPAERGHCDRPLPGACRRYCRRLVAHPQPPAAGHTAGGHSSVSV